jgi:hypothetical protein
MGYLSAEAVLGPEIPDEMTEPALEYPWTIEQDLAHPLAPIGMSPIALASRQQEAAPSVAQTAGSTAPQLANSSP